MSRPHGQPVLLPRRAARPCQHLQDVREVVRVNAFGDVVADAVTGGEAERPGGGTQGGDLRAGEHHRLVQMIEELFEQRGQAQAPDVAHQIVGAGRRMGRDHGSHCRCTSIRT